MHYYYVVTIKSDCAFHPFEWDNFTFTSGGNIPVVDETANADDPVIMVVCKSNPTVDVILYFENVSDIFIRYIGSIVKKML